MKRPSASSPYEVLSSQIDLPKIEKEILSFWSTQEIFHKSVAQRANGESWTFYEGPPTANGMPGTHHIEARVFKDVFPRYHTMKGKHVIRKAGWDCHGLPVEIAVEKELGFSGKGDIEKYGIARFNEKCRESVQRHVDAFTEMTERMGFWVDFDEAYWTMSDEYIESVWWSLAQIHKKGLLVQDHRVAPYCPRCGTGLSDHELAQGYETVTDPSVYVRFPITEGELAELGASLLVWTTTPWTLVSNTAVAVHPEVTYLVLRAEKEGSSEVLVIAEPLAEKVVPEHEVLKRIAGRNLEGLHYKRPLDLIEIPDAHFVVLAEYVTTEDGTGLVHQAPAFGADDLATCKKYELPVVNPVAANGEFLADVPLVGGKFFKDADKVLIKALKENGALFRHQTFQHSYPHCWRCHTPLIYYAQPSWYIRTTKIKDALLRENQGTDWHPETIKTGRFGDWLNNNIDWALSRNRYWGTPLPIWKCEEGHELAVASKRELSELSGRDLANLELHRPFVDEITIPCNSCGTTMTRTVEVIDCWYDSGAMPFAQWGYPHKPGSIDRFNEAYPADFICEAIDQTRGWFYTLMAIGTLVFDKSSYKTVLCLGHILDKDGRKMSKHLGNVLEPIPLMDRHGADAVRWYMLASGSPWSARRVGHEMISEVVRKTLLTYWNTVSFLALYASASDFDPKHGKTQTSSRPMMDRWILSELNRLIQTVDNAYADFDSQRAGSALAEFIDDLSNWYVRRSRRRFWDGDSDALNTLHECVEKVTLLMAPMVPFITEHVWQVLIRKVNPSSQTSVHLADFPISNSSEVDLKLSSDVSLTRRLVELGRAARAQSQVKIRQPLSRALISASGWKNLSPELKDQISDELNVENLDDLSSAGSDLVDISIKANFRTLGGKYGGAVQEIAKALNSLDPAELVKSIRTSGSRELKYSGGTAVLTEEDLVITETPRTGWSVASHTGESVALDLSLDQRLIDKGMVREAIRAIQDARKESGFDVSDRINVAWNAETEAIPAISAAARHISDEVLALAFNRDEKLAPSDGELGIVLKLEKA